MAKLGDLILRVGADTSKLNQGLGDARRSIAKNTREIQNLGRNLTVGITAPLAIMGATSVQAFREQNKAIAQVEAGLKSTAGQVGFTSQELQKMATDLQNKTLFGDEVILKDATAQLLTFTNISGQNFARTQQAALDLATRLDGDLKGASIQLGKALNDPVANLSALSRSGIQFSEDQKAVIKSLTETGNLAEAQTLILDELNKQYGGSAEAAAEADGGFTQLANSFGDLQEEIGRLLVQYLRPIVDRLKTFVQFLQGTSDGTKTLALAIAGVAAAIGPVLFILPNLIAGIKAAKIAFGALNATMLTNPFVLAAAAITGVATAAYLLYENSTDAQVEIKKLRDELNGLDKDEALRVAAARIEVQKEAIEKQRAAVEALRKTVMVGDAIERRIHNQSIARHSEELAAMEEALKGFEAVHAEILATEPAVTEVTESFAELGNATEQTTKKLKDKSNTLGFLINQLEEVPDTDIWKPIKDSTDQANHSLGALFNTLEEVPSIDYDRETMTQMEKDFEDLNKNITDSINGAVNSAIVGFGMMLGEGIATGQGMKGVGAMLLGVFADLAIQLGTLAIGYGIAIEQIKVALASLAGPVAIAAGVALVALGAGLKGAIAKRAEQSGVPAFAEGGLVYGPTMGLVGEYPGAKTNPEVIAPLDKLRGMLGGQQVQVTGKISGRDILLTSERNAIDRNRVRGF